MNKRLLSIINNPKGVMTIDYLFSFVLVFGFVLIMLALTMTLSVVEITQYITFASARSYMAGHRTEEMQKDAGFRKYVELTNHPIFRPLYNGGWFQIEARPTIGDIKPAQPKYASVTSPAAYLFYGTGTSFTAKALDFKVPFYGSTASENLNGEGFNTYIASYLGREPTFANSMSFVNERWKFIRTLPVPNGARYSTNTTDNGYVRIIDNGG